MPPVSQNPVSRRRAGSHVLAVDIGGTKMACGVVDEQGAIVASLVAPTPPGGDGEVVATALLGLVERTVLAAGAVDLVGCGVGCGGPMSGDRETVSPLNIAQWREFPLRARLAEATGLAVAIDNDAKALALGEGWRGAAVGQRDFVAMVVSTGVGGGIVVDGRLLDGASGNAGHVGHIIVEPGGRTCACGARGCVEAEASGTAIAAMTGAPAAQAPPAMRQRSGRMVGRAIATLAVVLDTRLVCIAGSVALGYGDDFFAAARQELAADARLSFARTVRIEPAGLGADGPLVGAAAVGWRAAGVDVGVA